MVLGWIGGFTFALLGLIVVSHTCQWWWVTARGGGRTAGFNPSDVAAEPACVGPSRRGTPPLEPFLPDVVADPSDR